MHTVVRPEQLFGREPVFEVGRLTEIAGRTALIDCWEAGAFDEYRLGWPGTSIQPFDVYKILESIAPDPFDNDPAEVVDDWKEPDNPNHLARERMARHSSRYNIEPHLSDFTKKPHRQLLIDVFNGVPMLGEHVEEVEMIQSDEDRAELAATYLADDPDNYSFLLKLQHAGLNQETTDQLNQIFSSFVYRPANNIDYAEKNLRISIFQDKVIPALKDALLKPNNYITRKIINSIVKPAKFDDNTGRFVEDGEELDDYFENYLVLNYGRFSTKYCVQPKQTPTGSTYAVGYRKPKHIPRYWPRRTSNAWLIPEHTTFETTEGGEGFIYKSAIIREPYGFETGHKSSWAALSSSIRSGRSAPFLKPEIRWRVNRNTQGREFVLVDKERRVSGRRVVSSGIFGAMLAAAMQPEATESWPEAMMGQTMGIVQVPVLTLMNRQRVADFGLLERAEELADAA